MGLLDYSPSIFSFGVFAFIRMENNGEWFELLFDFFLSCICIKLQNIIGVIEFLIGEPFKFGLHLQTFAFDVLKPNWVYVFAILINLLPSFISFVHSLILFLNYLQTHKRQMESYNKSEEINPQSLSNVWGHTFLSLNIFWASRKPKALSANWLICLFSTDYLKLFAISYSPCECCITSTIYAYGGQLRHTFSHRNQW